MRAEQGVRREVHPMKYVDEDLAELGNATVFSKLDANRGFWQLPLDEESKLLMEFNNECMDGLSKMSLTTSAWMDCPRCVQQ